MMLTLVLPLQCVPYNSFAISTSIHPMNSNISAFEGWIIRITYIKTMYILKITLLINICKNYCMYTPTCSLLNHKHVFCFLWAEIPHYKWFLFNGVCLASQILRLFIRFKLFLISGLHVNLPKMENTHILIN